MVMIISLCSPLHCLVSISEALLGGDTYVPSLSFKYGCFTFCEVGHVLVSIQPIYTSFVAIYSSLMSLSYSYVDCWNFTLTGPHELPGQGLLFFII